MQVLANARRLAQLHAFGRLIQLALRHAYRGRLRSGDRAAASIIAEHTGVLAAVDIEVLTTITFAVMQSLRPRSRAVPVTDLITHHFPLAQFAGALATMTSGQAIKVTIEP